MKKFYLTTLLLSALLCTKAEIIMPKVFSDNMVLQRQESVKIWGKADANASVKVEFANQSKEAKACENGNWSLYLEPMEANANNQNMQIFENGKAFKEIKDILVGEVWIAGGQSNIQWTLLNIKMPIKGNKRVDNPLLRLFTQDFSATSPKPEFDLPDDAKWSNCNQTTASNFSAIGFFFAENLARELNVPVGIIHSATGGAKMIAWIAEEDFAGNKHLEKILKDFKTNLSTYDYEAEMKAFNAKIEKLEKENTPEAKRKITGLNNLKKPKKGSFGYYRHEPYLLYNAKISPLAGFASRGVIWYQGESDAKTEEGTDNFSSVFEHLIKAWRKAWKNDSLPFYFIQLPSYEAKNMDWAKLRWQQYLTFDKVDNVEMVVAIDTGEEKSIHPVKKQSVGDRLANLVLAKTYKLDSVKGVYGAMLDKVEYKGNVAEVLFETFDCGLKLKGEARGFEVLVGDSWVLPESIDLDGAKIKLSSAEEIKGVRYLWKNWALPAVCLFSDFDLPAASFIDIKE